jgi:hypothetical protein
MGMPSSAVKPIVLSTLRPFASAHMDAPLPRCATIFFENSQTTQFAKKSRVLQHNRGKADAT